MQDLFDKYTGRDKRNLPSGLRVYEIVDLWCLGADQERIERYHIVLGSAIQRGALKAEVNLKHDSPSGRKSGAHLIHFPSVQTPYVFYAIVQREDFKAWLIREEQWPLDKDNALNAWFSSDDKSVPGDIEPLDAKERREYGTLKIEAQKQEAILRAACFAMQFCFDHQEKVTKDELSKALRINFKDLPESAFEKIRLAIREQFPGQYVKDGGRPSSKKD